MGKRTVLLVFILINTSYLFGQQQTLTNTYNRAATVLDGYWKYIVDPYENGYYNYRYEPFDQQSNPSANAYFLNSKPKDKTELIEYDFDQMDSLYVPGDWNSQKEKLYYYEGTVWYKKSFDYEKSKNSNRLFLYIGAANYKSEVYLNGQKLGTHVGGFTPIQYEITEQLRPRENHLIIKVDNKRLKEGVPTLNTDWWNYGGITRGVKIIETPETTIADYSVQVSATNPAKLQCKITLNGAKRANQNIQLRIPEVNINQTLTTSQNGIAELEIDAKNLTLWSPKNPKLYAIELTYGEDMVKDDIGFRTIATQGPDILLNGQSIFLKGISIHEESPLHPGRANTLEDATQLLNYAKSLGCNFVRLAHYPHNEHMVRIADKWGIMVWEEIPVYWTISWDNEQTYLNAQNQISDIIDRDRNRASVIIWSMANETPTSEPRNQFLQRLSTFTKKKDDTRLISAALEQKDYQNDPNTRTISDPFADVVDVLSFNQYIGWYDGTIEKCQRINWKITQNKPVIISEFGAGAKFGLHGEKHERWTEEYQEYLYQETLKMLDKIEQLRGISPWILMDFKSPRRPHPVIQEDYNRKGLLSEKGEKKKAFYVLKEYYDSKKSW